MDSLRVRWVPLLQSFRRLGAFALEMFFPVCPAFLGSDYYAPSDSCEDIRNFVGLSLTYSPLPFACLKGLRVHNEGLKRNGVGGVLLNAPSPLWGSPVFLQGRVRLTWSPRHSHPMEEAWVPALHKQRIAGSTG